MSTPKEPTTNQIAKLWAEGKRVFIINQTGDVIASGPTPKTTK